ncbi:MAG: hypothetical protein A2172_03785 [Candidatus Woykebacteria bacterium RBG_13_40_15]|uniref:GtrA/DPMS transmembrane domain-containing protein n=1 Tax=Candidatus Woykebacteria bacterium RBG_13_40_15 TaxID=1802593 RepID=A0A1G1WA52_9BACT|nr:MAG: hypothetical protein A2172_03785 [Candidatus Woykebacteria bacterium RBG_13_40_15]
MPKNLKFWSYLKSVHKRHIKTFICYILVGICTVLLNNFLLAVFLLIKFSKITSIILAYIGSTSFNFFVNSRFVFSNKPNLTFAFKYLLLFLANLIVIRLNSTFLLSFGMNVFLVNLISIALIVPMNYIIYRLYVFK